MVAPIKVTINGDTTGLNNALKEGSRSVSIFGNDLGVVLPPKLNLAVQATKKVVDITHKASSAARDAAAEEAIFADAMVAAGAAQGDWVAQTDEAIAASARLAFTDTETRKAIAALATATGDTEAALDLLTVAQDVARISGVDLEQAADAVAKAQNGQDAALRRMLPGLEKGATAQDTIKAATDLAAGAADNYARSSEAMGKKVRIAFGEIAETVGAALGPSLQELGRALKPLIQQFIQLASKILPPVLSLLSKLISIASKVVTAVNKITSAIGRLIDKIKKLLQPLQEAVNGLRNLDLNPFAAPSAAVATMGASTRASNSNRGPVTINIYGDPAVIEAKVIRAIRGYQARNGTTAVTPGKTLR